MEADKLEKILAAHRRWLNSKPGGRWAILVDANLQGADLRGANLEDANLQGADLGGARLQGASLQGADLRGADLRRANLVGADLGGADLGGADLVGADLVGADLVGADLVGADLRRANLRGANLRDAKLPQGTPAVTRAQIKAAVDAGGGLNMATWHRCDTTHCIAGWAVHLAGERGYEMETAMGTSAAAALILAAGGERVPDFQGTQEYGLAWLRGEV